MELSSLDIYHLVKEAQLLLNSRVQKAYQPKPAELHIELHVQGMGKQFLSVILPNLIYLGTEKESSDRPTGFAMALRKHLGSSRIRKIEQLGFDRIIKLNFEKDSKFHLYIELFLKGNVILTDDGDKVLASMNLKTQTRLFRPGMIYKHPELQPHPKKANLEELYDPTIEFAKWAAKSLSLGGEYARELCRRTNITQSAIALNVKEMDKVKDALKQMFNDFKPNRIKDRIYPIELETKGEPVDSFMSSIELLIAPKRQATKTKTLTSGHDKELKKQNNMIKAQKLRIKELEAQSEQDTKAGELIYQNYQEIEALLQEVKEKQKSLSKEDFEAFITSHKLIKSYDPKSHSITL